MYIFIECPIIHFSEMFRGIPGVVFHYLAGKNGWSTCRARCLDVSLIKNIDHRKRLFRILDRDCPYSLEVIYALPKVIESSGLVLTAEMDLGVGLNESVQLEQSITVRLHSKKACLDEISIISQKQESLRQLQVQLCRQIELLWEREYDQKATTELLFRELKDER